ncbi:MAG: efflux RND transporter periplasmic adaptor subunit [Deferribacteres bacterium]|nr:efflux RND transporter periplasmic adaptor subunit [Deferribacteres bacterium]
MDTENSGNKTARRVWGLLPALFLVLLIIVIVVLFVRIGSERERLRAEKLAALHKARPPVNVVVLDLRPMPIRDRLDLPAQVEPWVELRVAAEVPGRIVEVAAKEGDYVEKGDLLARIDTRDYENELEKIRAEYDLARKTLARTKGLYSEGLVTRERLDSDTARVEALGASMKNAGLRLRRCSINAPVSGIVNRLDAEEGLYMNTGDTVAVILEIDRIKVAAGIPESDVDAVGRLEYFDLTIDSLGGRTVRGRKHFLSKNTESFAHVYRLEIEVDNPGRDILPGMFARVNIVKKEVPDALSVPLYAIIAREDRQFVYVAEDGKARARTVETGILEGWRMQITKGVEPGDQVIVVGQRSVNDGREINIVRTVTDPEELLR